MKLFSCLRLLIVIGSVLGCAMSPTHLTPISESNRHLAYNGFSASAPMGGWSIVTSVNPPFTTSLYKKGQSKTNTIAANITVKSAQRLPPDELFKILEPLRKKEIETGRFRPVEVKVSRQQYRGAECQRYDSAAEDRGVPGHTGTVFILEVHGLSCLHPDNPTAFIDIQYSQRRLSTEQPVNITAEGEVFIKSLEFHPQTRPFITNTIEVTGSPQMVQPGHGSFWVTRMKENSVARISSDMSSITATIKTGDNPVGLAVTDTAVWVVNKDSNTMSRIDPNSNQVVTTVSVGPAPLLAIAAFGSIWVTNSGGSTVSRIDVKTNSVTIVPVGRHPSGITSAGNAVWVTNFSENTIQRIDPATGKAQDETIGVGKGPNFITGEGDSVWVNNQDDGTVYHIDTATGDVLVRVSVGSTLGGISVGHGFVWVADFGRGRVIRIDQKAGTIVDPPIPAGSRPLGVIATPEGVFVIDVTTELLYRIDP